MKRLGIWAKKPFNGFILDRRGTRTCMATFLMVATAISWAFLTVAIADTLPSTKEQALTQGDLVRAQWWLIGGLLGLVLIISQGFIIYVVSGVKANIRDIFAFHKHVVTTEGHKEIDHSLYCHKCRKEQ